MASFPSVTMLGQRNGTTVPWKELPWVNKVRQFVNDDETKKFINYAGNGGAAVTNLLTFINTNWTFTEPAKEWLENLSEKWTKVATGTQGLIGAIDLWKKKNTIPLIGNILEIPISIFSSGRNLWLFRGVSQGLGQFLRVIDQRELIDKNGEPIKKDGKEQIICGDFEDRGWWEGFSITCKEVPKILVELVSKPSKIKKLTHALSLASVCQIIGGTSALFGLEDFGAAIRNLSGIGVDFSLMLDENKKDGVDNSKNDKRWMGLNLSSIFTKAGCIWVGAAICDELKRLPFLEDKDIGLTSLSYFFDRGASVLYTNGNLSVKSKNNNIENHSEI